MKTRKQVVIFSVLFLLLVLPPMVYFYVTRGFNTFIKLEVIGQKDHKIANFSFINQNNEVVINDSLKGNINIANFDLPKKVDRTLSSIYKNSFQIPSIKQQINDQKEIDQTTIENMLKVANQLMMEN